MGQRGPNVTKVGDASDVQNVNPWTQQMFAQEGDMQNLLRGQMFGQGGQAGMLQRLMEADPNAFMGSFMQAAPGMQDLAMGATNPFARAQMDMAHDLAPQIADSVAAQYGGPGNAFYSGAAVDSMARGVGDAYNQAVSNITGAQTGMLQGLFGTAMPAFSQGHMHNQSMMGQTFGQLGGMFDSSMNRTGQASMPEWWQPTYHVSEGRGGLGGFFGGAAAGAGAMAPTGNPWLMGAGGLFGGLGGLFG